MLPPQPGDLDLVSITHADGSALSDQMHAKVLKDLGKSPVSTMHGETATWTKEGGAFKFKAKMEILNNGGKCCFAQVGPDGNVRAVRLDLGASRFKDSHNYSLYYDNGGYNMPTVIN